jgi:hypothetical protein
MWSTPPPLRCFPRSKCSRWRISIEKPWRSDRRRY